MALHVTQCPSCDSTFNASAHLLRAAQGLVRCGACLSVFDASDNVIPPDPMRDGDAASDPAADSVFISRPDEFFDALRFVRSAGGLILSTAPPSPTAQAAKTELPAPPPAEADFPLWQGGTVEPEPVSADAFMAAVSEALPDPEPEPVPEHMSPVEAPETPAGQVAEPVIAADPAIETPIAGQQQGESKAALRARLRATRLDDEEGDSLDALTPDALTALGQVPDALELEPLPTPSRLVYRMGMGSLCLLLSATLVLQFFWQRRELLSLHPDLRPGYVAACQWLGCTLPPLEAIDAIAIENLVVRSHPEQANALLVSAVLRNDAPFQQPFPVTRLRFSDTNLQSVASRDFQPGEYLPPSLRAIANMPINTPVQISLELMDPGEDAINYEVQLISRYP
ncbi:MAG: hypothetical protein RLZZ385_1558 [Pseudomonadota bacterium]|jgi:predicted Zn finger-like uncharacterized protein